MYKVDRDKETFPVTVQLLVDIYNSLTDNHFDIKESILDQITHIANSDIPMSTDPHVAKAFFINNDGRLDFDDALFREALYRAKIKTYTRASMKYVDNLRSSLNTLVRMGDAHKQALLDTDDEHYEKRLAHGEDISKESEELLFNISKLKKLLHDT